MISSQFKHPQVHVGNGVEGAAGQQDHWGFIMSLHTWFYCWIYTTVKHMVGEKNSVPWVNRALLIVPVDNMVNQLHEIL